MEQGELLTVLTRAPAGAVKALAEEIIPLLEPITVLENRTGLAMLPMRDPVAGATFFLGEVLLAEAWVRAGGAEGYAACLGRDLEQSLAVALLDAAYAGGVERAAIAAFAEREARAQAEEDAALLRQVAATRVEMETF
jgi:alpha-D-ribose 1-methylphosphonate 5-triphosphate synthase subunit PhnG